MTVPYAHTSSGMKAREEIQKILKGFGAESVGFMDEYETKSLLLAFKVRGQQVQLRASAQGWAAMWLKENPHTNNRRATRQQWEQAALDQGMIAVNSILRDWVKGQITAIETGILQFDHVFMPYMLASDGRPLLEHAQKLLPAPDGEAESTERGKKP